MPWFYFTQTVVDPQILTHHIIQANFSKLSSVTFKLLGSTVLFFINEHTTFLKTFFQKLNQHM